MRNAPSLAVTAGVRGFLFVASGSLVAFLGCGTPALPAGRTLATPVPSGPAPTDPPRLLQPQGNAESVETEAAPLGGPSDAPLPLQLVPTSPPREATLSLRVSPTATLESASSRGLWLAYCDAASANDSSEALRLARQSTNSPATSQPTIERIDALLAVSSRGRYVVVLERGVPWLVDTLLGVRIDLSSLSADLEADALADHRSFAFSPDEAELAVLSQGAQQARVLDLEKLARALPASLADAARLVSWQGPAWRLHYEQDVLVVQLAGVSGRYRGWPVPKSPEPVRRCGKELGRFSAFASLSEPHAAFALGVRLASRGMTHAAEAPGFLYAIEGGWVRREPDGRLVLVQGTVQRQLASQKCGGRILHADPKRRLFLVACEQYRPVSEAQAEGKAKKGQRAPAPVLRFPLYLVSPGLVIDLDADTLRTGIDVSPDFSSPRYVPVRPGAEAALLDMDERRLVRLGPDTVVVTTSAAQALLRRDRKLFLLDAGKERQLELSWLPLAPTGQSGAFFFHGSVYGRLGSPACSLADETPLWLSEQGWLVTRKFAPASGATAPGLELSSRGPCEPTALP